MEVININGKDCPMSSVQVYNDRAEITRAISTASLSKGGEAKLKIIHLVDELDPASIRIKGNIFVQILEVTHDRVVVEKGTQKASELQTLRDKKQELTLRIEYTMDQIIRLNTSKDLAKSFVESSFVRVSQVDSKSLDEAKEILAWYSAQIDTSATQRIDLKHQIDELNKEMEALDANICKIGAADGYMGGRNNYERTLTVMVDSKEFVASDEFPDGQPPLVLTYTVTNACWTPSYDVRINTEKNAMQLVYFAEVKQATGEDWSNVDMLLSTANPSVGSVPTPLSDTVVRQQQLRNDYGYGGGFSKGGGGVNRKKSGGQHQQQFHQFQSAPMQRRGTDSLGECESEDDDDRNSTVFMEESTFAATSNVKGGANSLTTAFVIPRKSTIESDNASHKVIIAELNFEPKIVHYTAPSTTDVSVYLQAKTKNSSTYALLQSKKVSVFLDGAFISTSSINQTSPGANFYLYLGVDAAIKCSFKAVSENETKAWGLVNSTRAKSYSFMTVITNSRSRQIKVLVADSLPKSQTEKIVVELVEPKLAAVKTIKTTFSKNAGMASIDEASLNMSSGVFKDESGSTLIWIATLEPAEKKTLDFKYQVTYSESMQIEVVNA